MVKELNIPETLVFPEEYKEYFEELIEKLKKAYEVAEKARAKGFDPQPFPEIKIASDMASRVEATVGPPGIAKRIRELLQQGKEVEEIAFIVAKEIAMGKWGQKDKREKAFQAIKTATSILVQGITAAPLEGVIDVKIRDDGHLAVYYAGPIRSAGGTEVALTVVIADIVRRTLGLPPYKPTKREIERYIEEVVLYDRYQHLQYPVVREKLEFALQHIPIEITGEGTLDVEVSGPYKNLPNVETNRVRGGAVLVINDGIIAKAKKVLKIVRRYGIEGWDWLEDLVHLEKEEEKNEEKGNNEIKVEPNSTYLADLPAGRPILSHPSRPGGFRLRYGRARNTGLAAVGIHPATMYLTGSFLAVGTQIKPERPGKGAITMPVDTIAPPIVRLKDGSVIAVRDVEQAIKIAEKVDKILFLGDILVGIGEFLENNHVILPSPIVEDWWVQELRERIKSKIENADEYSLDDLILKAERNPKFAFELMKKLRIPLHPKWTYFWRNITVEQLKVLKEKLVNREIIYDSEIKEILERLLVEHIVQDGKIILKEEDFDALRLTLDAIISFNGANALQVINNNGLIVYDKYPVFIGLRMGRPEKAKPRKMKPPVHALFPLGKLAQQSRSLKKVMEKSKIIEIEAVYKKCPRCGLITYKNLCPKCNVRTVYVYKCQKCGFESESPGICPRCNRELKPIRNYKVDIAKEFNEAARKLKVSPSIEVRAVIGLISRNKVPEPLEKGILRAKYKLFVFRDGTIRFDATDAPLTHFRPREIGVSVEKLRRLGYTKDINGKPLVSDDQILELKVQDIIINEEAAEYMVNVAKFIDELLVKFYGLEPFYNINSKEDLIGHLVIGIAPHTSAGILGRIIGFTKARVIYAHPYWHAAKRRNCDGDEDAIILLLDALLNFSREYLPVSRGGMMDAPLVITTILNPLEVDSEVYNLDVMKEIPLEFYRKSLNFAPPEEIEDIISNVEKKLGKPEQYVDFWFSFDTSDIALGPRETIYSKLSTMKEKVEYEFKVMSKIIAVDIKDAADRILEVHLLRDIVGNLRKYGVQEFRCKKCNARYRRIPLSGKCPKCGGEIVLTIRRGMALKYLSLARDLVRKWGAYEYSKSRLDVLESVDILFFVDQGILDVFEQYEKNKKESKTKDVVRGKNVINLVDFLG